MSPAALRSEVLANRAPYRGRHGQIVHHVRVLPTAEGAEGGEPVSAGKVDGPVAQVLPVGAAFDAAFAARRKLISLVPDYSPEVASPSILGGACLPVFDVLFNGAAGARKAFQRPQALGQRVSLW